MEKTDKELLREHRKARGGGSKTYRAWRGMRSRCYNKNGPYYSIYGGRGIRVCKRWDSFILFLEDMGECPDGRSIDRIDNDGNYEPNNCRWATLEEQNGNRSNSRMLVLNGEAKCLAHWARIIGLPEQTIRGRLDRGLSDEDALAKKCNQIA